MNTQTLPKHSSKMVSRSLTPRKVTPEAPRRSILTTNQNLPIFDEKDEKRDTSSLFITSLPFDDEKVTQRSLMPRVDPATRAADLLRKLPPRKISLRKRVPTTPSTQIVDNDDVVAVPSLLIPLNGEEAENTASFFTPLPSNKRLRLSPPPLLVGRYDTRFPLSFPAQPADLPAKLMFPSI